MKSYKRYLAKIENFQLKAIDPFLDVLVSGNYRFGDIEDLDSLEEFVLKEMAYEIPGNVKLKLKKLREMNNILMDFDKNYTVLRSRSKKNLLSSLDLCRYLPLFDATGGPDTVISPEYLLTIYQSVLSRQKSLLEMINKTEDLLVGS